MTNSKPGSWGWWEYCHCEGRKESYNFHLLQKLRTLETFDANEEGDPLSFHHHQGKNPHMQPLDQKLQPPVHNTIHINAKAVADDTMSILDKDQNMLQRISGWKSKSIQFIISSPFPFPFPHLCKECSLMRSTCLKSTYKYTIKLSTTIAKNQEVLYERSHDLWVDAFGRDFHITEIILSLIPFLRFQKFKASSPFRCLTL